MDFNILTHEEVPKTLYHYTSLEALVSIVRSKRLRASNIRFLNDRTESLRLKESVVEILQKRASSSEEQEMVSRIVDLIREHAAQSQFVASLSDKCDLLSQWRAYCPPGLGVSIGFSSDALTGQWIRNPSEEKEPYFLGASLQKVRYYGKVHQKKLEETVEKLLLLEREWASKGPIGEANVRLLSAVMPIVPGLKEGQQDALMEFTLKTIKQVEGKPFPSFPWQSGSSLASWAIVLSPLVKDDAFEEESEWRKVVSKENRLMPGQMFRQGKSTLIPFIEVMLDVKTLEAKCVQREKYFIDEVIIGPTPNPHLTEEALRSLFASEGHEEVQIRRSKVPFKDW